MSARREKLEPPLLKKEFTIPTALAYGGKSPLASAPRLNLLRELQVHSSLFCRRKVLRQFRCMGLRAKPTKQCFCSESGRNTIQYGLHTRLPCIEVCKRLFLGLWSYENQPEPLSHRSLDSSFIACMPLNWAAICNLALQNKGRTGHKEASKPSRPTQVLTDTEAPTRASKRLAP